MRCLAALLSPPSNDIFLNGANPVRDWRNEILVEVTDGDPRRVRKLKKDSAAVDRIDRVGALSSTEPLGSGKRRLPVVDRIDCIDVVPIGPIVSGV